jgi:hypothetical protein
MAESVADLNDPEFLKYLRSRFPNKIEPDEQDYGATLDSSVSEIEMAQDYQIAQANRLLRLWREWKAQSKN